jgi:hypothetical protein
MALKDLIAQRSALTEQQIEVIVARFVRYDLDEKAVMLTPEGGALLGKSRVLVYLVALQGWQFLTEEAVPMDAAPADLEKALNIPGGTLRPVLKGLKEQHRIIARDGRYSVPPSGLDAVMGELGAQSTDGREDQPAAKRRSGASSRRKVKATASTSEGKSGGGKIGKFNVLIQEGFFDTPRTLGDVRERFHEEGVIIPSTSLPTYLLAALHDKRLSRKKQEVDGKLKWMYQTRKAEAKT